MFVESSVFWVLEAAGLVLAQWGPIFLFRGARRSQGDNHEGESFEELVLQSLEHEMGGVRVYERAIVCAENVELKEEWQKYLEQTKSHVVALQKVCQAFDLDPRRETPGRKVVPGTWVRQLVQAIKCRASGR